MKRTTTEKKLNLKTKTIMSLRDKQLDRVAGGIPRPPGGYTFFCATTH
jgi:hypothetical protein